MSIILPFDIKYRPQIESGEIKVMTSVGEPAEIVKWDCRGNYPILAVMFDGDTDDSSFYTIEGKGYSHPDINYLVLVPTEQESEDERIRKALLKVVSGIDGGWPFEKHRITKKEAIAWLEKQKDRDLDIVPELRPTAWGEGYQHGVQDTEAKYAKMGFPKEKEEYIEGIRAELLGIEDSAPKIEGLTEPQWVAIRAAHRLLRECLEKQKEQKPDIEICPHSTKSKSYKETGYLSVTRFIYNKSDEEFIRDCANILKGNDYGTSAERLLSMLESQPAKWSEKDEKIRNGLIRLLYNTPNTQLLSVAGAGRDILDDWLQSLPERFGKPAENATTSEENTTTSELTELEKAVNRIGGFHYNEETMTDDQKKALKDNAERLLRIARKQLSPSFLDDKKKMAEMENKWLQEGIKMGREEMFNELQLIAKSGVIIGVADNKKEEEK